MKKSIKFIVLLFCLTIFTGCWLGDVWVYDYVIFQNNTEKDITIMFYQYKEDSVFAMDTVFIKSNSFYEKKRYDPVYFRDYHYIDLYLNNVFFKRYNGYEYWSSEEKSLYNLNYYIETQPNKSKIVYTYTFLPEDFE